MRSKSPIIIVILASAWVTSLAVYGYISDGYLAEIAGYDRNLQDATQEIKEKSQKITDLLQHTMSLENKMNKLERQLQKTEDRLRLEQEKSSQVAAVSAQLSSDLFALRRQYCQVILRINEYDGLPISFVQSIKSINDDAAVTSDDALIISLSECKHIAE